MLLGRPKLGSDLLTEIDRITHCPLLAKGCITCEAVKVELVRLVSALVGWAAVTWREGGRWESVSAPGLYLQTASSGLTTSPVQGRTMWSPGSLCHSAGSLRRRERVQKGGGGHKMKRQKVFFNWFFVSIQTLEILTWNYKTNTTRQAKSRDNLTPCECHVFEKMMIDAYQGKPKPEPTLYQS